MEADAVPYVHIEGLLSGEEITELGDACKRQLETLGIPCYGLIDRIDCPAFVKLKRALEQQLGEPLFYLNDFYIYTDHSFKTEWHVDTELFTFDRAVNAWILLHPSHIDDPLGFIDRINGPSQQNFHKVKLQEDVYVFEDYFSGDECSRPRADIEALQIHTPRIKVGDVVGFDPKKFHRTNANVAKHAISIKFLLKGRNGFRASTQVSPFFWPEVGLFNQLMEAHSDWDDVIAGIRCKLKDEAARKQLSAGFYPEKFELYKRMIKRL